jgi:hypothetical protein
LGYDLPLNRGIYSLGPLPPDASYSAPCDSPDNWIEVNFIGSSILVGRSPNVPWTPNHLSDPEARYVEDGKMQGSYETTAHTFHHTVVSWSLCREDAACPPPPEALPDDSPLPPRDPCAAPRALLSHAQAERQRALDRLKQISEEFVPLAAREATQRRTKDQLQGAFDKMLYAAMIADASTRLLEYATSSSMLKGAAATGQITAAQLRFMTRLDDAIEFYQAWLQFIDDPGGWGTSKLFGGGQDVVFGDGNRLGDFALDMFAYGQLLGSLVGLDDGSEALAYIETNLARFGPLIPSYSIGKARQYVEVSRAWADTIRTMSRLTTEAGRLTFDAEEMALNIAVSENRLEGC